MFFVNWNKKQFSRLPEDVTLEQIINPDAAGQRIGISGITNSISANGKWTETHYIRLKVHECRFENLPISYFHVKIIC